MSSSFRAQTLMKRGFAVNRRWGANEADTMKLLSSGPAPAVPMEWIARGSLERPFSLNCHFVMPEAEPDGESEPSARPEPRE